MMNSQNYWQQRADYKMSVKMDVKTFQYKGNQKINYTNNSPDTLNKVFFHLFFNAFQPGSEMAVRINSGADVNTRFKFSSIFPLIKLLPMIILSEPFIILSIGVQIRF